MLNFITLTALLTVLIHHCSCSQWDYFTFSQQWPPGTCAEADRERHDCAIPKEVNTWTIHGLWPSVFDTREPHDCNRSWHFDIDKVATIRADLDTYWPNLFNDTPVDSFWTHEWSKHGTCCTDLPATADELQYFTKGIVLNREFDISSILSDSGIVPSLDATYSFNDFMNAIKKETGFNPVLQCEVSTLKNGTKFHMISQIEICLDKTFKARTCYSKAVQQDRSDTYDKQHMASYDREYMAGQEDKDVGKKVEDSDTLYYRKRHRSGPQSDCPTHYEFYYQPMHTKPNLIQP